MNDKKKKTKTLTPSWKYFLISYLYSILLIPVFGIGLLSLYFVWSRHRKFKYIIEDTAIRAIDGIYSQRIDLVSVQSIHLHQNWIEEKLGVGSLQIVTNETQMIMRGIETPRSFKETLEHAVAYQQEQQKKQKEQNEPRSPKYDPGEIDRMNYLTGLWQQGLISEEDFQKEQTRHSTGED